MTNENVKTCELTLHAPCDFSGHNARQFCSAVIGMGGGVHIAKPRERRNCRGDSLVGVLSLCVKKGDIISLCAAERKAGQLAETIAALGGAEH